MTITFSAIYRYGLPIVLSLGLFSCEKDSPLGADLIEDEPVQVYYLDTATILMSTVLLDSMVTSNTGRLLVGYQTDAYLGSITSKAFFMPSRDSLTTYPEENKATYDSMTLLLDYDQYWYYDTLTPITYRLFQLDNELETYNDGYLYNSTTFPYDPTPDRALSTLTFNPRPHRKQIEMTLDAAFGQELFRQIISKNDLISSNSKFRQAYKGFVLTADSTEGPMVGFSTSSKFVIYYSESGASKNMVLPINDYSTYFSQISADRTGTPLQNLTSRKEDISTGVTHHTGFIQGGIGLGIRLEFPYLHTIREITKNTVVSEAYLQLRPVKNSYNNKVPLAGTLAVHEVNALNRIAATLNTNTNLYLDLEYKENTYYSISIKEFIQKQLQYTSFQGDGLLITLPDSTLQNSLTRIYLGDQDNEYESTLQLVVLTIDAKPL